MLDNKTDLEVTGGPVPEGFLTTKRRLLGEVLPNRVMLISWILDPIPKMDDDFEETSLGDACSQDVFVDSFVNGEHQLAGVFVNMFFVFTVFTLIWERFPIF